LTLLLFVNIPLVVGVALFFIIILSWLSSTVAFVLVAVAVALTVVGCTAVASSGKWYLRLGIHVAAMVGFAIASGFAIAVSDGPPDGELVRDVMSVVRGTVASSLLATMFGMPVVGVLFVVNEGLRRLSPTDRKTSLPERT